MQKVFFTMYKYIFSKKKVHWLAEEITFSNATKIYLQIEKIYYGSDILKNLKKISRTFLRLLF